jgi:hypothetical protein
VGASVKQPCAVSVLPTTRNEARIDTIRSQDVPPPPPSDPADPKIFLRWRPYYHPSRRSQFIRPPRYLSFDLVRAHVLCSPYHRNALEKKGGSGKSVGSKPRTRSVLSRMHIVTIELAPSGQDFVPAACRKRNTYRLSEYLWSGFPPKAGEMMWYAGRTSR